MNLGMISGNPKGADDEGNALHASVDRLCVATGGIGHGGPWMVPKVRMSEAMFYPWEQKLDGLGVQARRLKPLGANCKLSQLVEDIYFNNARRCFKMLLKGKRTGGENVPWTDIVVYLIKYQAT